jgi:hypothetical protein
MIHDDFIQLNAQYQSARLIQIAFTSLVIYLPITNALCHSEFKNEGAEEKKEGQTNGKRSISRCGRGDPVFDDSSKLILFVRSIISPYLLSKIFLYFGLGAHPLPVFMRGGS